MSVTENSNIEAEDRLQAAQQGVANCTYPFHSRLALGFQQIKVENLNLKKVLGA